MHATRDIFMGASTLAPYRLVDGRLGALGDTLVVDLVDFNDETWFDKGCFHSDALHLVERYADGPDRIRYEVTVGDRRCLRSPGR
jgi:hypothetical protein